MPVMWYGCVVADLRRAAREALYLEPESGFGVGVIIFDNVQKLSESFVAAAGRDHTSLKNLLQNKSLCGHMSASNVVVVTGCTQGLGYHAVKKFATDLANDTQGSLKYDCVVLCCRNVAAAKKAVEALAKQTKCDPSKLVVLEEGCNLCEMWSVRAYAAALKTFLGERKIISLVNNAGIGGNPTYKKTSQGFDIIWATNHLGHFLLTILLLRHLAPGSRIVNVSSGVHDPANKTQLPDADQYWPQTKDEYDQRLARGEPFTGDSAKPVWGPALFEAKLCNVLFTNELARRLSGAVPYALPDAALDSWRSAQAATCALPHAQTIQVRL
eukprot:CAMPEP_0113677164 /NCGR_PEP_ID=MMETSP0038_2-20120614/9093_1 /TAXON_ID=2898 /ORGANISM="Cryptomonas paramecium" /LENGTH=326 /DNA_ID=CAMNT_0000594367 /DNA_START=55 /DNA_END=1036 /DNA_ORIENTATION=- /assembly_acc=CAM_ASM_000170